VASVHERTVPAERPPLVDEVSANFVDRCCRVVSVTDSSGRNFDFLDRSRYFFFHVAPELYSRGWVDPVPDPLLLRKSGSIGNRTQNSGSAARNSYHLTTEKVNSERLDEYWLINTGLCVCDIPAFAWGTEEDHIDSQPTSRLRCRQSSSETQVKGFITWVNLILCWVMIRSVNN
jgi:hypothetical protein